MTTRNECPRRQRCTCLAVAVGGFAAWAWEGKQTQPNHPRNSLQRLLNASSLLPTLIARKRKRSRQILQPLPNGCVSFGRLSTELLKLLLYVCEIFVPTLLFYLRDNGQCTVEITKRHDAIGYIVELVAEK